MAHRPPEPSPPEVTLSVVIPCLDAADVLPVQLGALARQACPVPWEVVVADNGSSDGSREVAASFRGELPALTVVPVARKGRHHALNEGARTARGEWLVFVDADDEVAPGFLAAMARGLEAHPVVAGRLEHVRLNPDLDRSFGTIQTTGLQDGPGYLPYATGAAMGIRRGAFEAVGGFGGEMAYCEDADLSWKLQLAGYEIAFLPEAVLHYRQRGDLATMYRQHRNYGRGQAVLYRHYRHRGMPRRPWRTVLGDWWRLLKGLPRLRSAGEKARWVRRLGRAVGHLRGSLENRVLYP